MADDETAEQLPTTEETEEGAEPATTTPDEVQDEAAAPEGGTTEREGVPVEPASPPAENEGQEEPGQAPQRVSKTSEQREEPPTSPRTSGSKPKDEKTPDNQKRLSSPKKDAVLQRVFDSKGSLLDSESFVKDKLAEFKKKRETIANMIRDLESKVKEYKEKDNPTDEDIAQLKKYHTAFLEKLSEYEEMTRNVERLMGMADVSTSKLDRTMSGPPITKTEKPPSPEAGKPKRPSQQLDCIEEKLPKLIVCGTDMGDSVPRIIVCEPLKKSDMQPFHKTTSPQATGKCGGAVMTRLSECFENQQKLAAENAEMARVRHQLQEELMDKQNLLDSMRQQMMALESEKFRLHGENSELQKRLQMSPQPQRPGSPPMCKRELYMKMRGTSPDMEPVGPRGCCQDNMQDLVGQCRCKKRQ